MKVLLISPVRGLDPPCGDITYTEELVSRMARDVDYVTYDQAIANGDLIELCRQNWRLSPLLLLVNKIINVLRKYRVIYWEPFRFFSVRRGVFDLVHVHHYPFKILDKSCPVFYTSGAPIEDVYRDRRKYTRSKTELMSWIEIRLCHSLQVNHSSFFLPQIDCLAVYTEYYRDYIRRRLEFDSELIVLLPVFLGDIAINREKCDGNSFGIVAYDFYSKGGDTLVDACKKVRLVNRSATLHIVGNVPTEISKEDGIYVYGVKDRDYIVHKFLPCIDVFVYPTPHDCFSYVMLEALRAGCAVCTSDYVSMPEAVDFGNAGLISPVGDSDALADNMILMLDPVIRRKFQRAARLQFERKFDSSIVLSDMRAIYSKLIDAYALRWSTSDNVMK